MIALIAQQKTDSMADRVTQAASVDASSPLLDRTLELFRAIAACDQGALAGICDEQFGYVDVSDRGVPVSGSRARGGWVERLAGPRRAAC